MADAGDSSYIAGALFEDIQARAIIALSDTGIIVPLTNQANPPIADTVTWTVWNNGTNKLNSGDVGTHTEGSEISASEINSNKKTATLDMYSVRANLQDEARLSNIDNPSMKLAELVGNAMGAKLDLLAGAAMDSFATSVGVSTVGITIDNIYSALGNLNANGAMGVPNLVLHPNQVWGTYGISNDLVTSAQFGGTPTLADQMLLTGNVGSVAGISVNVSREIAENTNARKGGMFVPDALGTGWAGPAVTVEFERKATFLENNWVGSSFYATAVLLDNWGIEIHTKTS